MLIDQHYYAIASKATLLKPKTLPVPAGKFKDSFGLEWEDALNQGIVFNAIDACKYLGVDGAGLDAIWSKAKLVKFGGGFYWYESWICIAHCVSLPCMVCYKPMAAPR
jgi:hypothetical protein